jgi:hypothetical protein
VSVKLLMTWDILPGREQDYFEFVVRDFLPDVQGMGLEFSDAWFTMYGDHPQIMATAQMSDMSTLKEVLESSDWDAITQRLLDYVENFDIKVVPARSGFQL